MWKLQRTTKSIRACDELEDMYKRTCVYFLAKATKTHWALHHLIGACLLEDARVLVRCLVELVIILRYIGQDSNERCPLFVDYGVIPYWKVLNAAKDRSDFKLLRLPENQSKLEALRKKYERVKPRYPKPWWWSGVSVAEMAKQVGMETDYIFYRWDSGYVHSGAGTAQDYLKFDETRGLVITLLPRTAAEFPGTIFAACGYSRQVARTFRSVFEDELNSNPDASAEIDSLFIKIESEVTRLREAVESLRDYAVDRAIVRIGADPWNLWLLFGRLCLHPAEAGAVGRMEPAEQAARREHGVDDHHGL
jgi:hypothetical protein